MNDSPSRGSSRQMILVQEVRMTLFELSAAHHVHSDRISELVNEGALEPVGASRAEWRFNEHQWQQAGVCIRLQRDLGLNLPGVALALQLLEEIRALRERFE